MVSKPAPNLKVFACVFQTKEGTQMGHIIAEDEGSAARGLILTAKQKLTSIHVDIKEVPMTKRTWLGIIRC